MRATIAAALAAFTFAAGTPALADVKAGVDAWNQGDYPRAVNEWRPMAIGGNADAQFNLGQAYKLGRGVPVDLPVALEWFRKAAEQGHEKAADNYGLLLFQQGRREEALPYLKASTERGEPRAQYVYATALFNGDLVQRDWVRAYALMLRAADGGVSQATASLTQMDQFISEDERAQGRAMAATIASRPAPAVAKPIEVAQAAPAAPAKPAAKPIPKPVAKPAAPPVAVAEATPVPTIEGPIERPPVTKPATAAAMPATALATAPATSPAPAKSGNYRVQLGAFRENGRAQALWKSLTGKVNGLSAFTPTYLPTSGLTRLLVGPLASPAEAQRLCGRITPTGTPCVVLKM